MTDIESASENSEAQPINLKKRIFSVKNLIAFAAAGLVIYIFLRRFNIAEVFQIIGNANPLVYAAAIVIFYASLPLRGYRWRGLLLETGIDKPTYLLSRLYFLAWFVNSILPARIGDLYRAYLLKKNGRIRISLSLGVLFSEKVFDLVTIAVLVLIGGVAYLNHVADSRVVTPLLKGMAFVGFVILVFLVIAWKSRFLRNLVPQRLQEVYDTFSKGIFRTPALIPAIGTQSILIWLSESARLYLVMLALGYHFNLLMVLFVSQASLIVMSLPLTPAGLGLVELLIFAILIPAGLSQDAAAAVVIADRLISYWLLIGLGGIHFFFSGRIR